MNWIADNWVNILAAYGALVGVATVVVKMTPSQRDDAWLARAVKVLDFLSTVNPKAPKA